MLRIQSSRSGPKEDGWHTLQHDNGQKKTVMKMTGREVTE